MQVNQQRILVVDDEKGVRDSLRLLLKRHFHVETADNGEEALKVLETSPPDLVLLDVMMPKLDGIQTLREIKQKNSELPVIMLTAANTVKTAVEAMKLGAIDYLSKPFDVDALVALILDTLENSEAGKQVNPSAPEERRAEAPVADFGMLVGQCQTMRALFNKVEQIASKDTTVLITGDSGTGKELIARRIHELSPRAEMPFIAINCAAIPETLIESELFGHEKGAFTSASERRIGHFELANGGTLFLDEIGELGLAVQVKMLRFLQEQEFFRVGSSTPIRVNVRVIAATNKNLEQLIKQGKFRQDLFYRIHVINLALPALRDRFEDVVPLTQHFIKKFMPLYGQRQLQLSPETLDVLVQYNWPGNVRELENVIESLMALCPEDLVKPEHLPAKLSAPAEGGAVQFKVFTGDLNFEEAEKRFEQEMILKALRKTNFVQTRAADLLGISRRILKYKMDKLGITELLQQERPEKVSLNETSSKDAASAGEAISSAPDSGEGTPGVAENTSTES